MTASAWRMNPSIKTLGTRREFAVAGMIFDVVNGDYDRDVPYKRRQQIQPDVVLAEKMDNVRPPRLNTGEQLGDQDEIGRRSMARPVKSRDLDPRVYEGSTGDAFFWGAEQDLAGICQQLGIFDAIVERSRGDQGDPHVVFLRRRPHERECANLASTGACCRTAKIRRDRNPKFCI